jgi:hypothetical protein
MEKHCAQVRLFTSQQCNDGVSHACAQKSAYKILIDNIFPVKKYPHISKISTSVKY